MFDMIFWASSLMLLAQFFWEKESERAYIFGECGVTLAISTQFARRRVAIARCW